MKQTLLIHIGWHKTATSFIQLYLDKHREHLKKSNICYPFIDDRVPPREVKHSYFFLSLLNKLQISHKQQDLQISPFDELFALSVREIVDSGCRWAIISEEGLSEATPGIAQLMARYKEFFDDIKIVAYVRRQDYFFESLYSQFVKQKPYRNMLYLDEYIQQPKVRERADYAYILDLWAREFGRENILVMPFEKQTIAPDPLTCFFTLTGLPPDILHKLPVEQKKEHVTPPREVTEFFRHMNRSRADFFIRVLAEYLMKSGAPATDTKYFCRADREKILREYEASNRQVARTYLHKDNGVLFEEPVVDFPNCPQTWKGFNPIDLLDYALPISGKMSIEISRLRHQVLMMDKENKRLRSESLELRNENQRIGNVKKNLYRFMRKLYREIKQGWNAGKYK